MRSRKLAMDFRKKSMYQSRGPYSVTFDAPFSSCLTSYAESQVSPKQRAAYKTWGKDDSALKCPKHLKA